MNVRHMRLGLGIFFLLMGAALLVLRFGAPEAIAKFDPMRLFLGALLAIALGCWNLMRWYNAWLWFHERATPVRRPLQPDPTASGEEYNPEFDFDKKDGSAQ